MDLSVVVPTLNGRTQLVRCLDALSDHAPGVEVVVVNGPSTDGTTGMVRDRDDVDVLVEIADRNLNVARNAGIERARGEWIAFVSDEYSIESGWFDALCEASSVDDAREPDSRLARVLPDPLVGAARTMAEATRTITTSSRRLAARVRTDDRSDETIDDDASGRDAVEGRAHHDETRESPTDADRSGGEGADENSTDERSSIERDGRTSGPPAVVTGPIHRELAGGTTTQFAQSRSVAGRVVTYFNPDNVAVRRDALDDTDGFDEYLQVGGARDLAHRLAAREYPVMWEGRMCVRGEYGADGTGRDPRWSARALSYRLVKNYGLRPVVARRVGERIAGTGFAGVRDAIRGEVTLSGWFAGARDVAWGTTLGAVDGLRARWRDRERHNPNGRSARADRAIEVYDRR